jgi:hypothetical protein
MINMETLVPWKKKRDKYDDDGDGDFIDARAPRLIDTIQDVEFISRDETNATAMRKMNIKWW